MDYIDAKILNREQLIRRLKGFPRPIATTNGAFDILHRGHIYTFLEAAKRGNLIVGINSDESVRRYKGNDRPINNQYDRAYMVAALDFVAYATIFEEDNPIELLSIIKPDFHVKSKSGFKGLEREVVETNGGDIVLLEDIEGYSTTNILQARNS